MELTQPNFRVKSWVSSCFAKSWIRKANYSSSRETCWWVVERSPSSGCCKTIDVLFPSESLSSFMDWCSYPTPLTLSAQPAHRPSLCLVSHCPFSSPLRHCHCVFCVFVFINSCVCPLVLKATSIWVKHFETNQKPRFSSPAVSHTLLYVPPLLTGPVCKFN